MAAVYGALFATGLLALYFPARWASHLDPSDSLRAE
jgi:ABC-type lipoprotein release transport system permease subunit